MPELPPEKKLDELAKINETSPFLQKDSPEMGDIQGGKTGMKAESSFIDYGLFQLKFQGKTFKILHLRIKKRNNGISAAVSGTTIQFYKHDNVSFNIQLTFDAKTDIIR